MKNWNLRTIVFLRSLAMVILPLWYYIYRSSLQMAFIYILLYGIIMLMTNKLDELAKTQMDECAQALIDKLTRNVEWLTTILVLFAILFLTQIPKAADPGTMALVTAQILTWGLFGIHLYRGIAFWVKDWMGSRC